jgi:micrococcal nuclease
MYEYRCKVVKIVDGDTVDVDIDLGFGIVLKDERVRIMGIDTPESRTRDLVEKKFGLASKAKLKELLKGQPVLKTQINKDGEDMKGKFGRILGDFIVEDGYGGYKNGSLVTKILINEGYAVKYMGGSKDKTKAAHMKNRKKLIEEGLVEMSLEEAGIE